MLGPQHTFLDEVATAAEQSEALAVLPVSGKRKATTLGEPLVEAGLDVITEASRRQGHLRKGGGSNGFRVSAMLDKRIRELLGNETTNKDYNKFLMKAVDAALAGSPMFLSEFKFSRLVKQAKVRMKRGIDSATNDVEREEATGEPENGLNPQIVEHVHKIVMAELRVARKYDLILLWNKVNRVSKGFSLENFETCLEKFNDIVVTRGENGVGTVTIKDVESTDSLQSIAALETKSGLPPHSMNNLMRFVSTRDWNGTEIHEMSVEKGTIMVALSAKGQQMNMMRLDTKETGFVPLNILYGTG